MNSCYHSLPATLGLKSIYPKKIPEELKLPSIQGQQSLPLTEKQEYLALHKLTKDPYLLKEKILSKDKRKTIFTEVQVISTHNAR